MILHELLTKRREELGLTREDVVSRSGVPRGTVSKIMSGHTLNPQIESLKAIVYALGLTLESIDDSDKTQASMSDALYISRPTGNADTDELRRQLHDFIDQLSDDDLRAMSVMIKFNRE